MEGIAAGAGATALIFGGIATIVKCEMDSSADRCGKASIPTPFTSKDYVNNERLIWFCAGVLTTVTAIFTFGGSSKK